MHLHLQDAVASFHLEVRGEFLAVIVETWPADKPFRCRCAHYLSSISDSYLQVNSANWAGFPQMCCCFDSKPKLLHSSLICKGPREFAN